MTDETQKRPYAYALVPLYEPDIPPGKVSLSAAAVMTCALSGRILSGHGGAGVFLSPEIVAELEAGTIGYGEKTPCVLVHRHENGDVDYHKTQGTRLVVVDERVPGDRVYEWTTDATMAQIEAIIGEDPLGSADEERHAALANRIDALVEGRPVLSLHIDQDTKTD